MEIQGVVIDTDVLILLEKRRKTEELINLYETYITFITLYEYIRGLRKKGKTKKELSLIDKYLKRIFEVIWPTNKTVLISSDVWSDLSDKGKILDDRDLLIGALCIEKNLPLWTLNRKHFERLSSYGLKLVDLSSRII
ncbi:MAG: type II toxin-antitoxin system VapC family toxin [Candidatus Njordarchaeia archaeon]